MAIVGKVGSVSEYSSWWINQPVAQSKIKALAPEDLGLLGSRNPRYGGRVVPRAVYATG